VIDLHCHILPALDDGALDLEDAVGMARQGEDDGIATICATPHIRHDHDVVVGELARRVGLLNAELRARGVETRVVTGAEVAVTALAGLDDDELRLASLGGGGRWILLEPAPGPLDDSLDRAVDTLELRGFRSVIAHPERHPHRDLGDHLARLVRRGALVQATAALLERGHAAPVIVELARRGLVHVLGSDAHSSRAGRPVRLSGGFAALRGGPEEPAGPEDPSRRVDWMAHVAPAAILAGEEIAPR
jgi:protein-tyrosine phosphatase